MPLKSNRLIQKGFFALIFLLPLFLFYSCHHECDPCPEIPDPEIPVEGQYCISRLNKSVDGNIQYQVDSTYLCEDDETVRGTFTLTLRVPSSSLVGCDETVPPFPLSGSQVGPVLSASGQFISRPDSLAHLLGNAQFDFLGPEDNEVTEFLTGTIELISNISTFQTFEPDCPQDCDQQRHMEGWVIGNGVGDFSQYALRASININIDFLNPNQSATISPSSRLTGVLFTGL